MHSCVGTPGLLVKKTATGLLRQDSKRLTIRKRIQKDAGDGRGIEIKHLPDSTAEDESTAVLEVRSMSHGKDAEKS